MLIEYAGSADSIVWKSPNVFVPYGAMLIVPENMEVIFYKDGKAVALFVPGRYTLDAQAFPVLNTVFNRLTDSTEGFAGEYYFIKKSSAISAKWGTDTKISLFDPASGIHVEIGASGDFTVKVTDSQKMLSKFVNSTDSISQNQLLGGDKGYFRGIIMTNVKTILAQTIKASGISILEIDERLVELSAILKDKLNEVIADYGVEMPEFLVARIITPTREEDPNFWRMKEQYAERYLKVKDEQIRNEVAQAEAVRMATEMKYEQQRKVMAAHGDADVIRILAQAEADRRIIEGKATVEVGKMTGDSAPSPIPLAATAAPVAAGSAVANAAIPAAALAADLWDCSCGKTGIDGNFCSNCGGRRPEKMVPATWNCACGKTGIDGNFCSNCGSRKPE